VFDSTGECRYGESVGDSIDVNRWQPILSIVLVRALILATPPLNKLLKPNILE